MDTKWDKIWDKVFDWALKTIFVISMIFAIFLISALVVSYFNYQKDETEQVQVMCKDCNCNKSVIYEEK